MKRSVLGLLGLCSLMLVSCGGNSSNKVNKPNNTNTVSTTSSENEKTGEEYTIKYFFVLDRNDRQKKFGIEQKGVLVNSESFLGSTHTSMSTSNEDVDINQYLSIYNANDNPMNVTISNTFICNESSKQEIEIAPNLLQSFEDGIVIKANGHITLNINAKFKDENTYNEELYESARYYYKLDLKNDDTDDIYHIEYHLHNELDEYEQKDIKISNVEEEVTLDNGLKIKYTRLNHDNAFSYLYDYFELTNPTADSISFKIDKIYLYKDDKIASNHSGSLDYDSGSSSYMSRYDINPINPDAIIKYEISTYYSSSLENINQYELGYVLYDITNKTKTLIKVAFN